jgi:hypothetical protein
MIMNGGDTILFHTQLVLHGIDATASSERLVFGREGQSEVNYLYFEDNPNSVYERVAWYEEAGF